MNAADPGSTEPWLTEPWPTELKLRRAARVLEVAFDSGERFAIPAERLRLMSPSAADRGHGASSDTPLEMDASAVGIVAVLPVGRYAVRLSFDDGHATGLYTWALLHRLGRESAPAPA